MNWFYAYKMGKELDKKCGNINSGFKPNTISILGDSISNQNLDGSGDTGFFTWANIFLGQRFKVVSYAGVSGNTLKQMLARIQKDVMDYHPQYCMFMGGINCIRDGDSTASIISELSEIYSKLKANNIQIITSTITPTSSAGGFDTADKKKIWHEVNDWIRRNAQESDNIFLVEMGKAITDPATSDPLVNMMQQPSDLHPGTPAAFLMGKELANRLINVIKPIELFAFDNGDNKVLNANSMQIGNSSGKSTGCTVSGGANTPTKVARTDGCTGEWQSIDSTTTTEVIYQTDTVTTGFAIGEQTYAQAEISVGAITNLQKIQLIVRFLDASNTVLAYVSTLNHSTTNNFDLNQGNWNGVLKTSSLTIPTGTTKMYAQIRFNGIAKVSIGRIEIRKEQG